MIKLHQLSIQPSASEQKMCNMIKDRLNQTRAEVLYRKITIRHHQKNTQNIKTQFS